MTFIRVFIFFRHQAQQCLQRDNVDIAMMHKQFGKLFMQKDIANAGEENEGQTFYRMYYKFTKRKRKETS